MVSIARPSSSPPPTMPPNNATNWFRWIATISLIAWGIIWFVSTRPIENKEEEALLHETSTPPLQYTQKILLDQEIAYMLPSTTTTSEVKGLLIFFHGCNHSGEDMFLLPEDRIVAAEAMQRGLAVLSITSHDRINGCWNKNVDIVEITNSSIIEVWQQSMGLSPSLPRMGMGASSGGAMAVWAAKSLKLKSVASYIMAVPYENEEDAVPTIFVHMPRDTRTALRVQHAKEKLQTQGVPTKELNIPSHAFTKQVCMQRIPEMGDKQCQSLIDKAIEEKLLKKQTNLVRSFGQSWDPLFRKLKLDQSLTTTKTENPNVDFHGHSWLWAAANEEVAVCYGYHEMTAEYSSVVLNFLMKHAGI